MVRYTQAEVRDDRGYFDDIIVMHDGAEVDHALADGRATTRISQGRSGTRSRESFVQEPIVQMADGDPDLSVPSGGSHLRTPG